jgi:NAD(P)-dependent dehydrogenase (short-subunit alcohol dehydrogenase family)
MSFDTGAVFITGGSRGLGLEIARQFGRQGVAVAICARDAAELERAASSLRGDGIEAKAYCADVRDRESIGKAIAAAEAEVGPIEVLVNNAGIISVGPFDVMTHDDFKDALDTHFWGALHASEAVLPAMRRRKHGRIVNVASIGGRIRVPHLLPYSVSKFALVGYSEGMRAELRREGVLVTTVTPGLMRTGSPENARFKGRHRSEYAWFTISDSLPLVSVDVTEAAAAIVAAAGRGDAALTISLPAIAGSLLHGIAPGLVSDLLGIVAALLPKPGGIGTQSRAGHDSHSSIAPSVLTASTQRRAETQNETAGRS